MEIWYKRSMSENYMVIPGTELETGRDVSDSHIAGKPGSRTSSL